MQQPQIYFDIDKTMLDTKQLMSNCQNALQGVGVDGAVFATTLNQYLATLPSKTLFDPEVFLDLLANSSQASKDIVQKKFWLPENFGNALFPEVLATLQTLSSKCMLGTFSQGVSSWQQKKLDLSGLSEFFPDEEKRIIESNKLANKVIDRLEKGAWVIDDKEIVVETLEAVRPDLRVFWIVRNDEHTQQNSIQSLTEVLEKLISQPI
jgi:hypothetical protein